MLVLATLAGPPYQAEVGFAAPVEPYQVELGSGAEVSQGAVFVLPLGEEDGGGGAGASSVAKFGKSERFASGTFTIEELLAFGGLNDDEAVREWFVEVKGVEVGVAEKVVSKLTAVGKLGDRDFDAELKRCKVPHGGLSIGCMAGLEGGPRGGRRRRRGQPRS